MSTYTRTKNRVAKKGRKENLQRTALVFMFQKLWQILKHFTKSHFINHKPLIFWQKLENENENSTTHVDWHSILCM